jgi:hypothetical protein
MKTGALHVGIHDELFEGKSAASQKCVAAVPEIGEKSTNSVPMILGEAPKLTQPAACFAHGGEAARPDEAGARSLFLELCGGSCRVSRCFENKGQEALGVDWKCNKSEAEAKSILVDLTTAMGQDLIFEMLAQSPVVFVHMSPPCGTASRARDKRLPKGCDPLPLRSNAYPSGLPSLAGLNLERVTKANVLYSFCAEVAVRCSRRGILWVALLGLRGAMDTHFSQCMHSRDPIRRNKVTKLRHVVLELEQLGIECDGSHDHAPWGISYQDGKPSFATSEERIYPLLLCQRLVACILKACRRLKFRVAAAVATTSKAARVKQQVGKQPRGHKGANLVPEFKQICLLEPLNDAEDAFVASWTGGLKWSAEPISFGGFAMPPGSKVVQRLSENGVSGKRRFRIGIAWSPKEFLDECVKVTHPFDDKVGLDDDIVVAAFRLCIQSPAETARSRLEATKF